jgi:hypothetical protein
VVAAFLIGFLNYPMQVVGWKLDQMPGDPIDNKLNNFILEHGYRWLSGRAVSFWDAPSFFPVSGTTAKSDAHIGMLPLYAVVRLMGASPEQAFQGHFLIACLLNFLAATWALRQLGFSPVGIAVGAFVFTYALPVVGQTQHTQLIPRFLVPPAFALAWEFLRFPRTRRLAAVAACCVGQFYLTVYIGYFLVLLLAAGFLVAVVRFPHLLAWRTLIRPGLRTWLCRVTVVGIAFAATLPLIVRHAKASGGGSPPEAIRDIAMVPGSWITSPQNAYLHPTSGWSPLPKAELPSGEHLWCPGLVVIAVVLLVAARGVLPVRTDETRVAVLAAWVTLMLAILVTRWGEIWLYKPLLALPGAAGIRVPARVVLVLLFPAGIALSKLVDGAVRSARHAGSVPGFLTAVLAIALVTADQRLVPADDAHKEEWHYYRNPLAVTLVRQARLAEAINRRSSVTFVYVFPSAADGPGGTMGLQAEVIRTTQDLGLTSVNGWTGHFPKKWDNFSTYRSLLAWLTVDNEVSPEQLAGMVVVGEPVPDEDPAYEALMRATYPPQRLRDLSMFTTEVRASVASEAVR